MGTRSPFEDEYEAEALSILSRFCEAAIHLLDDSDAAIKYANTVVKQSFEHWFGDLSKNKNFEELTLELVKTLCESYPSKPERVQDEPSE
jgi:hypothetical protein